MIEFKEEEIKNKGRKRERKGWWRRRQGGAENGDENKETSRKRISEMTQGQRKHGQEQEAFEGLLQFEIKGVIE